MSLTLMEPSAPSISRAVGSPIPLSLADRITILGQTGTGKTTVGIQLLYRIREFFPTVPIQILDSSQIGDFRGWAGGWRKDSIPPLIHDGHLIWQPTADNVDLYDQWLEGIYAARRRCVVFINELSSLAGPSYGKHPKYPFSLYKLLKQGRGHKIMMVVLSQDAAYMPRPVLGQATHLLRFQLLNSYDGREMDRLQNAIGAGNIPHLHGFRYNRTDEPGRLPDYFPSYHHFIERLRAA